MYQPWEKINNIRAVYVTILPFTPASKALDVNLNKVLNIVR